MASVGTLLREARVKAGLTQAQVGEAVETDGNNYSRYERDEILPPRRRRQKLAKLLGIDPDALERAAGATPAPRREAAERAADPYPALTAAASFARLSDDFPDRALLEEVLRDASGRVHHETAESTGSSDAMLKWLRRLYIVAESRRTPEGRQAEQTEREASAATAASRPRLVSRLPERTKTAPKPKS